VQGTFGFVEPVVGVVKDQRDEIQGSVPADGGALPIGVCGAEDGAGQPVTGAGQGADDLVRPGVVGRGLGWARCGPVLFA